MSANPKHPRPGEESIPAGEEAAIELIRQKNIAAIRARLAAGPKPTRAQRAQHPKGHGCVRARFEVRGGLPQWARQGVLQEPRVFEALVRFSNGRQQDDRKGDMHGMAIKLLDVPGESGPTEQDFILADHPVFMVRDALNYVPFMEYVPDVDASTLANLKFALAFGVWHRSWNGVKIARALSKVIPCVLAMTYHSQTPYRLGNTAVKYRAIPTHDLAGLRPGPADSPDRLREGLKGYLADAGRTAAFAFAVQRQSDDVAATPIEDATVEWKDRDTEIVTVADLQIPAQEEFLSDAARADCEGRVFMPWNCLDAHRPLGGINRARKPIYAGSAQERRDLNAAAPTGG